MRAFDSYFVYTSYYQSGDNCYVVLSALSISKSNEDNVTDAISDTCIINDLHHVEINGSLRSGFSTAN